MLLGDSLVTHADAAVLQLVAFLGQVVLDAIYQVVNVGGGRPRPERHTHVTPDQQTMHVHHLPEQFTKQTSTAVRHSVHNVNDTKAKLITSAPGSDSDSNVKGGEGAISVTFGSEVP